jgi:hypothetical protein
LTLIFYCSIAFVFNFSTTDALILIKLFVKWTQFYCQQKTAALDTMKNSNCVCFFMCEIWLNNKVEEWRHCEVNTWRFQISCVIPFYRSFLFVALFALKFCKSDLDNSFEFFVSTFKVLLIAFVIPIFVEGFCYHKRASKIPLLTIQKSSFSSMI